MILLYNAKIWGYPKEINSVIIKDEKIFFIGEFNKIPSGVYRQKISLKNKLLLPSFIDTHTHFAEYSRLKSQINCSNIKNIEELKQSIEENPNKIKGYALKISLFDKKELHNYFLNLKREPQITIASSDYHSYLTSAIGLTDWPIAVRAGSHTCPPDESLDEYPNESLTLSQSINDLYKYGITTIHEMAFSRIDFEIYDEISSKLDVIRHFPLEMLDDMIEKKMKRGGRSSATTVTDVALLHPLDRDGSKDANLLRLEGGLKLFYDGSIGSNTALMFSSKIDVRAGLCACPSILEENIKKALNNGFSVAVHAIGDKAVDDIVNIFIKYKNLIKNFVRIEHAQTITDETIKKLETISDKVYLSMQPLHIRDDYELLKNKEIKNTSFRFKSLENMTIGFSSDVPVVEFNPFLGIYHAITHKLNPTEAISPQKAIENYTINAAKLSYTQNIKGSIEIGKLANLILIDDYRDYDENFWLSCKNYLTILKGDFVFNELF